MTGPLFDDPAREALWRSRVRAPRVSLPQYAGGNPQRGVYGSSASGTAQIYAWDRDKDEHRQVTARPAGTLDAAITADGEELWWFEDRDGDEFGHWMREPFQAPAPAGAQLAIKGLPDGYNNGIALGVGVSAVCLSSDSGTTLWIVRASGEPRRIYQHLADAPMCAMSHDDELVALNHSEHGDSTNPGVLVLSTADGRVVGNRVDPGTSLTPQAFSPPAVDGHQLLTAHERRGKTELLIWDLEHDTETELQIPLDGDLTGRWYPDGSALLIAHDHAGRSTLHRFDLRTSQLVDIPTPRGCIDEVQVRRDGGIEYSWSSAEQPWQTRLVDPQRGDQPLLAPPGRAPTSVALTDEWIDGPGGPIHTFISYPVEQVSGPRPTVFRLHGGPHAADQDSYNAMRAAWIDAGFVVVQLNYRGSTGYGAAWRKAIINRPGLTELEDLMAVLRWCIDTGITDARASIVEGYSWGGLLALLAVGVHPDSWAAAIGGLPVADCVAAYQDEMQPLRDMDRALFGGTPEEVPEAFEVASAVTYAGRVRAPVLLLAGTNDPRCPIRQIEEYAGALERAGVHHQLLRFDVGHGPQDAALVESFIVASVSFARSALASELG